MDNPADPRHNLIRQRILELYAHNNPGLKCPWSGRTGTILKRILKQNPSWPVEAFIRCVDNRFASEGVNLSQAPDDWLDNHRSRLVNYARAPLDRFGAPKPIPNPDALKKWGDRVNAEAQQYVNRMREKGLVH